MYSVWSLQGSQRQVIGSMEGYASSSQNDLLGLQLANHTKVQNDFNNKLSAQISELNSKIKSLQASEKVNTEKMQKVRMAVQAEGVSLDKIDKEIKGIQEWIQGVEGMVK